MTFSGRGGVTFLMSCCWWACFCLRSEISLHRASFSLNNKTMVTFTVQPPHLLLQGCFHNFPLTSSVQLAWHQCSPVCYEHFEHSPRSWSGLPVESQCPLAGCQKPEVRNESDLAFMVSTQHWMHRLDLIILYLPHNREIHLLQHQKV